MGGGDTCPPLDRISPPLEREPSTLAFPLKGCEGVVPKIQISTPCSKRNAHIQGIGGGRGGGANSSGVAMSYGGWGGVPLVLSYGGWGGSSGVVLWRMGGFLWCCPMEDGGGGGFLWCCPMEDGGVPLVLSYGGWGGVPLVLSYGGIFLHMLYTSSTYSRAEEHQSQLQIPATSSKKPQKPEVSIATADQRPLQGFIQDFLLGRGKKITQGYSCQHLIKSLTPSNAHCD